jgi:hypothetical protein
MGYIAYKNLLVTSLKLEWSKGIEARNGSPCGGAVSSSRLGYSPDKSIEKAAEHFL